MSMSMTEAPSPASIQKRELALHGRCSKKRVPKSGLAALHAFTRLTAMLRRTARHLSQHYARMKS